MSTKTVYTLGDVARLNGCKVWQARRLYERCLLDEPQRLGTYRVVHADELPAITVALREAGYLPAESQAVVVE